MPLLPSLVSPEEIRDALGDERVRVFDATVFLRRAVDGGPYTVESGRESYARAHIPGAVFADPKDGWIIGHLGIVLHTVDGGQSWTRQLDGITAASLALAAAKQESTGPGDPNVLQANLQNAQQLVSDGPDKPFLAITVTDTDHALIAGAYGIAFQTEDAGAHWQAVQDRFDDGDGWHIYALAGTGARTGNVDARDGVVGPHVAVIHVAAVNVVSRNLPLRVDAPGAGALVCSGARSRSIQRRELAPGTAHVGAKRIGRQSVVSHYCPLPVDVCRDGALACAGAGARSLELNWFLRGRPD